MKLFMISNIQILSLASL